MKVIISKDNVACMPNGQSLSLNICTNNPVNPRHSPINVGVSPRGPGKVLDLSLGRGCRSDLETLTLFTIKKKKVRENHGKLIPYLWFSGEIPHIFHQNAWILDPVYKKIFKIFEFDTLFMSGQSKNHTLKPRHVPV